MLEGQTCYGVDLRDASIDSLFKKRQLDLSMLLYGYAHFDKTKFFDAVWFDKLAGTNAFREAIEKGWSEDQIRSSWKPDLDAFNVRRKKYLLYKDFE